MLAFHSLENNRSLAAHEYECARERAAFVQKAFDQADDIAACERANAALFRAANVWKPLNPKPGTRFRSDYDYINHLRLHHTWFSGFHPAILDRLDSGRRFKTSNIEAIEYICAANGSAELGERLATTIDPAPRMIQYLGMQRMVTHNIPSEYIVCTPQMFGEIGLMLDGVLCNADTILCQTRINALYVSGALAAIDKIIADRGTCRILEIGTGYGGLARAIMALFPGSIEYVCCDLPASLLHSAIYLGHFVQTSKVVTLDDTAIDSLRGRSSCVFSPNYLIDAIVGPEHPIDVAINTMSMPEMSAQQVEFYCQLIVGSLRVDGFFYEANNVIHPRHVDCKSIFAHYFQHRRGIANEAIATGGETHEIWSNAPFRPNTPPVPSDNGVALPDQAESLLIDALGRALMQYTAEIPQELREKLMLATIQELVAAGMPGNTVSTTVSSLNW